MHLSPCRPGVLGGQDPAQAAQQCRGQGKEAWVPPMPPDARLAVFPDTVTAPAHHSRGHKLREVKELAQVHTAAQCHQYCLPDPKALLLHSTTNPGLPEASVAASIKRKVNLFLYFLLYQLLVPGVFPCEPRRGLDLQAISTKPAASKGSGQHSKVSPARRGCRRSLWGLRAASGICPPPAPGSSCVWVQKGQEKAASSSWDRGCQAPKGTVLGSQRPVGHVTPPLSISAHAPLSPEQTFHEHSPTWTRCRALSREQKQRSPRQERVGEARGATRSEHCQCRARGSLWGPN